MLFLLHLLNEQANPSQHFLCHVSDFASQWNALISKWFTFNFWLYIATTWKKWNQLQKSVSSHVFLCLFQFTKKKTNLSEWKEEFKCLITIGFMLLYQNTLIIDSSIANKTWCSKWKFAMAIREGKKERERRRERERGDRKKRRMI